MSYTNTTLDPVHGTGQGSSSLLAHWLLISSILMDCLSVLETGMTMLDPGNVETLKQWIDGFIDNTLLFINLPFECDDIKQLTKLLTEDMGIWEQLVSASGGKLEHSRYFYYVLAWRFTAKGNCIPLTIKEVKAAGATVK
jgi:hypothetical protein